MRSAPGRGSSLSAAARLPSTKRRLVRYTVEPPTPTRPGDLLVAGSCIGCQQDLCPLQLARRMLAAAQQRPELGAFRLAQLDPVPYIHFLIS
jgi:hypothetical protein